MFLQENGTSKSSVNIIDLIQNSAFEANAQTCIVILDDIGTPIAGNASMNKIEWLKLGFEVLFYLSILLIVLQAFFFKDK